MATLAAVLVLAVALIHVGIAIVEMCFWKHPKVHERLDYNEDQAKQVAPIVANAGQYNGFTAAGLFWGLSQGAAGYSVQVFFLVCVIVAEVFGAITLRLTTLLLQSIPGILALIALCLTRQVN